MRGLFHFNWSLFISFEMQTPFLFLKKGKKMAKKGKEKKKERIPHPWNGEEFVVLDSRFCGYSDEGRVIRRYLARLPSDPPEIHYIFERLRNGKPTNLKTLLGDIDEQLCFEQTFKRSRKGLKVTPKAQQLSLFG